MPNSASAAAASASVSNPTALDYLKSLGDVAAPLTVALVIVAILTLAALIRFNWFEVNVALGTFSVKIQRPRKEDDSVSLIAVQADPIAGATENIPDETSIDQAQAQTGVPAVEADVSNAPNIMEYFSAATLFDLDRLYGPFVAELGGDSIEFWETDYKRRRADFGADNGREAVRQLAEKNPTWASPYGVLIGWSLGDHDHASAEDYLLAGLQRTSSDQFGDVLNAGVKLKYEKYGADHAALFCAEWSVASIPERFKAGAYYKLGELLKASGDTEGQRVALEWASIMLPSNLRTVFTLAYSYGDEQARWASSMWHYWRMLSKDGEGPVARNNLAVMLGNFDKRVQIENYEIASLDGDVHAVANLAKLMIADGYVRAGERVLARVEPNGSGAENHASATSAALAARRTMEQREEELRAIVRQESGSYRSSLSKSLRHAQTKPAAPFGYYTSEDELTVLLIEDDTVTLRARIGTIDCVGAFNFGVVCSSGTMKSGGGLFSSFECDVTLLVEGPGQISLFRWPNLAGEVHKTIHVRLNAVDAEPVPPPPIEITPSALPATGTALLAVGKRYS